MLIRIRVPVTIHGPTFTKTLVTNQIISSTLWLGGGPLINHLKRDQYDVVRPSHDPREE